MHGRRIPGDPRAWSRFYGALGGQGFQDLAQAQEVYDSAKLEAQAWKPQGQQWGKSQDFSQQNRSGAIPMLSIGPWPTPRPVRIDYEVRGAPNASGNVASQATVNAVQLRWTINYSVGQAGVQQANLGDPPRFVVATQVSLIVERLDTVTPPEDVVNVAVWASIERPSVPVIVDSETVTLAIGVATATMRRPPPLATHVMIGGCPASTERWLYEVQTVAAGSFNTLVAANGLTGGAANVPQVAAVPFNAVAYRVQRTVTTAVENIGIFYLRA